MCIYLIKVSEYNTLFDVPNYNFRQQILQYLNILREVNKTEKKNISQNLYSTLYKFKINYEMSQFLRKKRKYLGAVIYIMF